MGFSYRSRTILAMAGVAMLVGIVMGIGIVLLINRPTTSDVDRAYASPVASPVQAAMGNTGLQASSATPSTPTASPTATLAAMSTTLQTATAATAPTEKPTVVPTTAPTEKPTVVPTITPTATSAPTQTTVPTTAQRSAAALLEEVAAAEKKLQTGQLEAAIDYGNGNRSSARVRFDLREGQQMPSFHIVTTYEGAEGSQAVERITIGERSWQRQPDGQWVALPAQESAWGELQAFLPHADSGSNPKVDQEGNSTVLRWYDAGRDAEVTLVVDPVTGIPRELRRLNRAADVELRVIYTGWNTAVEIRPPDGR